MDKIDINQLEQNQSSERLMDESVSIEQSRELNNKARQFGHDTVTDAQVKNEMTFSMMNCMPCKRIDE